MATILIAEAEGFSARAIQVLRSAGLEVRPSDLDRTGLERSVADADVLWVRLRHAVDRDLIGQAPRLRAVVSTTTGTTHIDEAALAERGIDLICLRGSEAFLRSVPATAEFTVALTLALLRNLREAWSDVEDGHWDRDRFKGRDLREQVVGLVGLGRVGSMVAALLQPFGSRVVAVDPSPSPFAPSNVEMVDLPELLQIADIVSVHASAVVGASPILGDSELRSMKRGALLVNTARGELVDEKALAFELSSGHLGGAAVDVLSGEPSGISASPLVALARSLPRLLVTPHLGGCTVESMARTEDHLARIVVDFMKNERGTSD